VRSFIRWAGSKRLSLPYLRPYCRPPRGKYIEPFAGSACLFFELEPSSAILGDLNRELISAMRAIRRDVYRVLECLRRLRTGKAAYYKIRRSVTGELSDPELAARFLYINRHCFNGLYRTNQRGEFPPRYRSALADAENTFRNGSPAQGCLLVQQEIEQLSRRIARKTQTKNLWRPLKPGERAPRFSDKTAWARVMDILLEHIDLNLCPTPDRSLLNRIAGMTSQRNEGGHKPATLKALVKRDRELRTRFESAVDTLYDLISQSRHLRV
jgi:hypothetical protein